MANNVTSLGMLDILQLPDALNQRMVYGTPECKFSIRWACNLIRYFEREQAAREVTFPAIVYLPEGMLDGFLDVRRDGTYAIRLAH